MLASRIKAIGDLVKRLIPRLDGEEEKVGAGHKNRSQTNRKVRLVLNTFKGKDGRAALTLGLGRLWNKRETADFFVGAVGLNSYEGFNVVEDDAFDSERAFGVYNGSHECTVA